MYVWLRLITRSIPALAGKRLSILDESRLKLRVGLGDVDTNRHLNNGRYLTIMDLGRNDLMFRAGLLTMAVKRRWMPVVAEATIRFRRSLNLFASYTLTTRLVYWDQKWIFIEQRFEKDGQLYALAYVRGAIKSPKGLVNPAEVARTMGVDPNPPAPPAELLAWRAAGGGSQMGK